MTPKQAFDETMSRARGLLKLHNGLTNRRRYRIRKDWKQRFCSLMRWPKSANIQRVDSADAVVVLRANAKLQSSDFSPDELADLLRSALVLGVSSLDRYLHERVTKLIVRALRSPKLLRPQEEFSVPASLALKLAADLLKAQKAGKLKRPANEVRKVLQDTLYKRSFQAWREVEYAFNLIGINDVAAQLRTISSGPGIKPLQNQLNQIVRRRNQIVHEGDLVRHARGGKARRHTIDPAYVEQSLNFLDDLVSKLERVS